MLAIAALSCMGVMCLPELGRIPRFAQALRAAQGERETPAGRRASPQSPRKPTPFHSVQAVSPAGARESVSCEAWKGREDVQAGLFSPIILATKHKIQTKGR